MNTPPDPDLDDVMALARQRRAAEQWEERRAEREAFEAKFPELQAHWERLSPQHQTEIDELLRALLEPEE